MFIVYNYFEYIDIILTKCNVYLSLYFMFFGLKNV